jgi:hypothetical protein
VEGRIDVVLLTGEDAEKAAERSKGSLWELLRRKRDLRGLWCCWRWEGGRFGAAVVVEGESLKVTLGAAAGASFEACEVVWEGRLGRSLSEVEPLRLRVMSLDATSETRTPPMSRLEEVEVRAGNVK